LRSVQVEITSDHFKVSSTSDEGQDQVKFSSNSRSRSGHVRSGQVKTKHFMIDLVRFISGQVISCHIRRKSIQVRSRETGRVISRSGKVMSGQVRIGSG